MGKSCWAAVAASLMVGLGGCSSLPIPGISSNAATSNASTTTPEIEFPPRPLTLLYTTFQDHAVLQRDKPIPVWGLTRPRAKVTVTFGSETASVTADASGKWQAVLAPLPAGGPYAMTAQSSAGKTQTIKDVLLGDVYLCSGQSNMEMPVRVVPNYDADIREATNPNIRLFHVQRFSSATPRETFGADATWSVTSPATVGEFSATCYNFGKSLQPAVHVPVGLIEGAWGGSYIQTWISKDKMHELGGYDQYLDILPIYAASPKQGEKKWREIAHAWWTAHDPASSATPAWNDPAYDDSAWDTVLQTGTWRGWSVPALKTFNGVVWLRQTIELSASQAKGAAVLSLGTIDQSDTAWVNGIEVGDSQGYDTKRIYDIPAGALHEGKNLIAVGVLCGGGMLIPADQMTLKLADGSLVRFSAQWRYKMSAPTSQTGTIANIPWLYQFGLTVLYNGMILPLGPTTVRGILWYQGESDAGQPKEYSSLLPALIADWRQRFGADVPFLIVQLPGFGPPSAKPQESDWADLREVQRRVVNNTPNAGLAVTIDLGQIDNLHPTNKQAVGARLALLARKIVYGENITAMGPTPASATRTGNTVAIRFENIGKGLVVYESSRPISFEICDTARHCSFTDAVKNGDEIDLDVSHVTGAASVRFCWSDSPICNVCNTEGLPAVPFEIPIARTTPAQSITPLVRKPRHHHMRAVKTKM